MMNKNLSVAGKLFLYPLIIVLLFLSSCQRKFASFQAGSRETFEHHSIPRLREQPAPRIEKIPEPAAVPEENEAISNMEELPVYHIPRIEKIISGFKKKQSKTISKEDDLQKVFQKEKPKKKKDKRKKPKFNDGLKTGTIFLLIAVIMGFFSLTQLTLLFGLVSILFLYFGLKKYYRQQRRRNIFK
jgi:hypothetical protein